METIGVAFVLVFVLWTVCKAVSWLFNLKNQPRCPRCGCVEIEQTELIWSGLYRGEAKYKCHVCGNTWSKTLYD